LKLAFPLEWISGGLLSFVKWLRICDSFEGCDEQWKLLVTFDAAEAFLSSQQSGSAPAEAHLP
jgi:hypothetical protein